MAKVTLSPEFESISGRLCSRNKSVIAVNKKTGKMVRYDYHEHEDPNTDKQKAVRATFSQKAKAATDWWHANKPANDAEPTAAWKAFCTKYDAQNKIGNPFSYLRTLVKDDLTINLGSTVSNAHTNSGTEQPPTTMD